MIPTKVKKRGTPAVAARNAEQALGNLFQKRDILAHSLKEHSKVGLSPETLTTLPKSIRQFNLWKGEFRWPGKRSATVAYHANSNETLRANPGLREDVQHLVSAIRALGERKLTGRREDTMRALRSQLRAERELTAIANREVVRARFLLGDLREKHESVRESKKSTDDEARTRIEELETQVQKLEGEIAGLRQKLRAERPLRPV